MNREEAHGPDQRGQQRSVSTPPADVVAVHPRGRGLEDSPDKASVIVAVDGSARSIDALVLAADMAASLRARLDIAHVHPLGRLSSIFSEDEHELIMRGIAEATFDQVRTNLPSVPDRRLQLVSDKSPAAGLHALAEREKPALMVAGSSHWSNVGRILVGGTAERLLAGAPVPIAVAPAGYSAATRPIEVVGCGFDGSPESHRALAWASESDRLGAALHPRCPRAHVIRGPRSQRRTRHGVAQRHPARSAQGAAWRSGRRRPSPTHRRIKRA